MNIKKLTLAYFSPTLSTKRIAMLVGHGLGLRVSTKMLDITYPKEREKKQVFGPDEFLIVASPTYGGRLPQVQPGLLDGFEGQATPAAFIIVYGDRGYDDSLLELRGLLEEHGFAPIAAAAFIAEHANSPLVGAGRPDTADIASIKEFSQKLREKLDIAEPSNLLETVLGQLPGNYPYKELPPSPPMAPITNSECVLCMMCWRWCPTGAITYNNPKETDAEKCIACKGCVKRCPTKARVLDNDTIRARVAALEGMFSDIRHDPELFL